MRRCVFRFLLVSAAAMFLAPAFPHAARAESKAPALSTKMSEEGTSIELGEEQTRKLAIMARLLRTNEFQTILGALRFPDTKLVATPSQPEYLRFLKSLTEFGMAQRVNSPTNVQHMPAEVQNTLNYFKLNADAKKAIAGILKAAKPEEAVDIDAKLGL